MSNTLKPEYWTIALEEENKRLREEVMKLRNEIDRLKKLNIN